MKKRDLEDLLNACYFGISNLKVKENNRYDLIASRATQRFSLVLNHTSTGIQDVVIPECDAEKFRKEFHKYYQLHKKTNSGDNNS